MKLLKLTLKNFKGIKDLTLSPDGKNISIYGDNATGKTTICDSVSWLLFNRDSLGNAQFDIKTIKDGQVIHKLEHSVIGEFSHGDKKIKLSKVYAESWPKKRGQATASFTGHVTKYFVDDVPVKQNEYNQTVEKIANDEVFKLLTSPLYFASQLHWEKRRNILLDVCGDISNDDIIASNKELADLPNILEGRTPEQAKKIIKANRSLLNKELDNIPVRIDEVESGLPENPVGASRSIEDVSGEIDNLKDDIRRVETGGEIAKKEKELAEIDTKIIGVKNYYLNKQGEVAGDTINNTTKIKADISESENLIIAYNERQTAIKKEIIENSREMDRLRDEWAEVDMQKFSYKKNNVCPTCNQFLPDEQIEEARSKAERSFNADKSAQLGQIELAGKLLKQKNNDLKNEGKTLSDNTSKADNILKALREKLSATKEPTLPDFTKDTKYISLVAEKEKLQNDISGLKSDAQGEITTKQKIIEKLEDEKEAIIGDCVIVEKIKAGRKRIDELSEEQKKLSAEFEQTERYLYLLDIFEKTKVSLLEGNINGKFKLVRFKLFKEQVNGGIQPCCDVTVDDIPYSTGLNNAGKINAGLDIINTLSDYYGVLVPVFIDNAESIVSLIKIKSQMIRLVVSGDDKTLKIV